MDVLKLHSIIFILLVTSEKLANSQWYNGRKYKVCETKGLKLPFYPCHKWDKAKGTCGLKDALNGGYYKKFSECLECIKRNNSNPYPHEIPTCSTKCTADRVWCELQKKCIHQNQICDCGLDHTDCTYIAKDKIERIGGKEVYVHGARTVYRCFSSEDLESRKKTGEYRICPDGSCKEKYSNCTVTDASESLTNETDGITNETDGNRKEKTANESSSINLGLAVGLPLTFFILVGGVIVGAIFYCKRKKEETMWVDDNPDYGEADECDEATVVVDANEYYGKNDDDEEETAIVDLNSDYGRCGSAKPEDILESSNEEDDDQIDNDEKRIDSVIYDHMSSQENDYD